MRTKSTVFRDAVHVVSLANFLQKSVNEHHIQTITDSLKKQYLHRNQQEISAIIEFMNDFHYFIRIRNKYNAEFYKELCKHLYLKEFAPNQTISLGKTTYIILNGRVKVQQEYDITRPKTVTDFSNEPEPKSQELAFGQSFNEFGFGDLIKCTAVTIRKTQFACLDFSVIQELNQNMKSCDNLEKLQFLKTISYFQCLSENEMKYLTYHLESAKVLKNTILFEEKDTNCEWIYFLKSGDVSLFKNKTIQISKLIEGEIFGEESFLQYSERQFTAVTTNDICQIYRVTKEELERRLWYKESRRILVTLISQKWIFRLHRFEQLTKNKANQSELLEHLDVLNNLLNADSKMQFEIPDYEGESQDPEIEINMSKGLVPPSVILKNMKKAREILNDIKEQDKRSTFLKIQHVKKLRDQYPKFELPNKMRKSLLVKSQSTVNQRKVSSKINFLESNSKLTFQGQLNNFLSQQNVKDDDVDWGDDGTQQDRDNRINHFYENIEKYTEQVYYQNQNWTETNSTKAKALNKEYAELVQKQKDNITNIFDMQAKTKTDNMLKKEYFLKQLKKMQKRLQVLQMIKKGLLTCKFNQFVNEDGEIVEIEEEKKENDEYEIINGKKQLKFNFVTSISNYKKKNKFKDFDKQIVEQKEQIHNIKEIVFGNLDPTEEPQLNEEFLKSTHQFRKPPIISPTFITSFSQKQRITSASFKSEMASLHSNQILSVKNFNKLNKAAV